MAGFEVSTEAKHFHELRCILKSIERANPEDRIDVGSPSRDMNRAVPVALLVAWNWLRLPDGDLDLSRTTLVVPNRPHL
jgi:hypothetical protein